MIGANSYCATCVAAIYAGFSTMGVLDLDYAEDLRSRDRRHSRMTGKGKLSKFKALPRRLRLPRNNSHCLRLRAVVSVSLWNCRKWR
jgi:hypothetical protein